MDPIPETAEAIEEYGPFMSDGEDALIRLKAMAARVRSLVPDCVGMSVAILEDGVTLTLVATDAEIAAMDGVQYVSDGPCVSAVDVDRTVEYRSTDPLDERSWQLFAQVTSASGIASTLTLPLMEDDQVRGSVNLYAATPEAFTGQHQAVATIVGGWARGAVINADLGFTTRRTAEQAPQILDEDMRIHVAVGIIVATEDVDAATARARLRQAAERAGVSEADLARKIIGSLASPEDATRPEDRGDPDPPGGPVDHDA